MKLPSKGIFAAVAAMLAALPLLKLAASPRKRVVSAAAGELGKGSAAPYWQDVLGSAIGAPPEWCGAFTLWALHRAGLAKDWKWEIGKGYLYRLPTTTNPEPGDVAYFDRFQHQAIVESVTPTDVVLLNGNGAGGKVTRTNVPRSNVRAFYSIAPLLKAKQA